MLQVLTRAVGGAAQQVVMLDRALPERGYASEIACGVDTLGEGAVDLPSRSSDLTIASLGRPVRPLRDVAAYSALRRLIADRSPDILHTHQSKAGVLARQAARRSAVPILVHTFHGPSLESLFPRRVAALFMAVERRLAQHSTALIADSEALKDELLDRGVGRPERWHVVPNGVDIEGLRSRRVSKQDARAGLGLPSAGLVVGTIGRLSDIKDQRLFLESAALVAEQRSDVSFVVAGSGELREELEELGRRKLGRRVTFVGHVDDPSVFFSAVDVVALTSRYEGTPLSLIEAGGLGIPVVATDVGGVREVVTDGESGVLVGGRAARDFAAATASLLDAPARLEEMGRAAANSMLKRFDVARMVADTVAVYETARKRTKTDRS